MPNNSTRSSAVYQCPHCGSDLSIDQEPSGQFSYQCQNEACQWACELTCVKQAARVRSELEAFADCGMCKRSNGGKNLSVMPKNGIVKPLGLPAFLKRIVPPPKHATGLPVALHRGGTA